MKVDVKKNKRSKLVYKRFFVLGLGLVVITLIGLTVYLLNYNRTLAQCPSIDKIVKQSIDTKDFKKALSTYKAIPACDVNNSMAKKIPYDDKKKFIPYYSTIAQVAIFYKDKSTAQNAANNSISLYDSMSDSEKYDSSVASYVAAAARARTAE